MTRLVLSRATGRIHRLPDAEAAAAIARDEGVPMQAVRFTVSNVGVYRQGETATFSDVDAARLIARDLAEPVSLDDAHAPPIQGKELDHPPVDRMVRSATTKG